MADDTIEKISASEQKKEDWMNSKWRPMMGWMYMVVCSFDFVIAPILWSLLQSLSHGSVNTQWQPLTLQGAGLFHIAMGAVLGIAAYGRTQEKLNGANNGGIQLPANAGTTYIPPSAGGMNNSGFNTPQGGPAAFSAPSTGSFSAPNTSFNPAPSWGTTPVSTGFSGKKVVPDFPQPAI
jgi:Holin of 3TMs, for gene-transfer release